MRDYRPDIDGLRAIAVLLVVLFHAGVPGFPGGYLGVDVFFVISGFLITGIVVREVDAGRFSFAAFYERRVRRLAPALLLVMGVTLLVGGWVLLPREWILAAKGVISGLGFCANYWLARQSGYFAPAASENPFVHLWSLSVEEQFYLVFPSLLWVLSRWGRRWLTPVVVAIGIASLVHAELSVRAGSPLGFYGLLARAWELVLGAAMAIAAPSGKLWGKRNAEVVGIVGLLGIVGSGMLYDATTLVPGIAAVVPTLGAASIIRAGQVSPGMVARLLATRPMVLIGRASYSIYLWHWPALVLVEKWLPDGRGSVGTALTVLGSIAVGVASWRYVENPFREKRWLPTRRSVFVGAFATSCLLAVAGGAVLSRQGAPGRLPTAAQRVLAQRSGSSCPPAGADTRAAPASCWLGDGDGDGEASVVVWGDSHARAMGPAFDEALAETSRSGILLWHAGCPPFLGVRREARFDFDCTRRVEAAVREIERIRPRTVALVARWAFWSEGTRGIDENGEGATISIPDGPPSGGSDNHDIVRVALDRTISRLRAAGARVLVVQSVPEVGWHVPAEIARRSWRRRPFDLVVSQREHEERQRFVDGLLRDLAAEGAIDRIDPAGVLCGRGACSVQERGVALYVDDDHLTIEGAHRVAPALVPSFRASL